MPVNKKRLLIIGGSGYLGSHLKENLCSDFEIEYTTRQKKEKAIQIDFLDTHSFKNLSESSKFDLVIITVSSMLGLGTIELKEDYLKTDTLGLSAFLQYLTEKKISSKFIFISSMTVYGKENNLPVQENGILNPISTYGLSKLLAETIFKFYTISNHLSGVILRIPGLYGGNRNSGFIYNTIKNCVQNKPIELNTSTLGYWEAMHINDLCVWIKEFISNYNWPLCINEYNIAYGEASDFIDTAYFIKETLKSKSTITEIDKKGYVEFYLDNKKIQPYLQSKKDYKSSLRQYIENIK